VILSPQRYSCLILEIRQLYLWGERITVRPERPDGGQTADLPFSPFDSSAPMFAVTLAAVLSIIFFLIGAFYFTNLRIDRLKLNVLNPFKQHIYIALGVLLLYMALVNYMMFLYRLFGEFVVREGIYLLIGSVFFAILSLTGSLRARRSYYLKPKDIQVK